MFLWMSSLDSFCLYFFVRLPGAPPILRLLSGRESICQCRRCRFDTWVGKICFSRKWQPIPVFLPGKFHGQRSLVGYSPWGGKELDKPQCTIQENLQADSRGGCLGPRKKPFISTRYCLDESERGV